MAKNGRPPMKAAREYATKEIIDEHPEQFAELTAEYLTDRGWEQTTTSTTKWTHKGEKDA